MKYRITLNQATYIYTSHDMTFRPDRVWERFYIDFESDNKSLEFDKIDFFEPNCIRIVSCNIRNAVQIDPNPFSSKPDILFTGLLESLERNGKNVHYMYWWSIKRIV